MVHPPGIGEGYGSTGFGIKQGFRVTRERMVKGVRTVEVVHGITSLSAERADAATLLGLIRDHWRIENPLHYVRDVTLGEDACRVRKGTAPQVLAALRNAVVHLLSRVRAKSCPRPSNNFKYTRTKHRRLSASRKVNKGTALPGEKFPSHLVMYAGEIYT